MATTIVKGLLYTLLNMGDIVRHSHVYFYIEPKVKNVKIID